MNFIYEFHKEIQFDLKKDWGIPNNKFRLLVINVNT